VKPPSTYHLMFTVWFLTSHNFDVFNLLMRYLPIRLCKRSLCFLLYTTVELAFNQYLADQQWLNTFRVETAPAIWNEKTWLFPASNGLSALSCYDSMSDPPFEASTDYVKDALHDIAWSQTLSFFFVVSCLFVKFCVVSGIIFGKEFRKIYWTLHQVGLPSVSLCWFWFHCPAQSRYKYEDLEELEIYQLETQLLVVSKNLQVESERGTWWNIGCGRSSCAFEADSWCRVFSIFFALIFGGSTVSNVQNAAKLFQLTFVWHAKLQIVVAAKTSNDAKGSFCRHIT